jgi:hypothetical protein
MVAVAAPAVYRASESEQPIMNYYGDESTTETTEEQTIPAVTTDDPLNQAEAEAIEGETGDGLVKRQYK